MKPHLFLRCLQKSRRLLSAISPKLSRSCCIRKKLVCVSAPVNQISQLVDVALCQTEKDERRLSAETKRALEKSKVNGKCSVKHFLSDWCVVFGHGGADRFIRGIFHSAGYVSSHASHQLQGPCVRNGCHCSSAVGQQHETPSSRSFIAAFKFSLPAVETRSGQLSCFYLKKTKPKQRGLLLLDDHLFLKGSSVVVQYVLRKVIWYMRQVLVLRLCSQPVVSGTHCQEHNAVLLRCANSTLQCLPLMSQNTPRIMYIHPSGFPKGHETQCVISGALLPRLCSFIAALQPGGVSLCPDRQSQGWMTESPPNSGCAARWSCVCCIAGGQSEKIQWLLTALLGMAWPPVTATLIPSLCLSALPSPLPFQR